MIAHEISMARTRLFSILIGLAVFFGIALVRGQESTKHFSFNDYLLAPVRVHLLSARAVPLVQTTLRESDVKRILAKLNAIWAQAGLHFYLESLVSEEANEPETYAQPATEGDSSGLLRLRPFDSQATNMFHIYYLKQMAMNGIYFPEAIFVKDSASLRMVPGGIDEPLPRVTSHELGHALGLPHRQDTTNLMSSGTTGIWLNETEIQQARSVARGIGWIESAPDAMNRASRVAQRTLEIIRM